MNLNEPPSLLRNDLKAKRNWIKVKCEGVKSNRSAIGARVLVRYGGKVQAQTVLSQASFYSCNDPRLHFGLGAASKIDKVVLHWPSGNEQVLENVAVDRVITVEEPK